MCIKMLLFYELATEPSRGFRYFSATEPSRHRGNMIETYKIIHGLYDTAVAQCGTKLDNESR